MPKLDDATRGEVDADIQRKERDPVAINKRDHRAMINAADDWWIDEGFAIYNAALPAAVRSNTTRKQQVKALVEVLKRSYELE